MRRYSAPNFRVWLPMNRDTDALAVCVVCVGLVIGLAAAFRWVSVERSIHERFRIGVGDRVRFDILGRPVAARVTSVRDVEWKDSRNGGFMFVFRPGPIERAPHALLAFVGGLAAPEARAVFDDIKKFRQVEDVNNFWKHLANDPKTLRRTWESVRAVMAPGTLDPLVKDNIAGLLRQEIVAGRLAPGEPLMSRDNLASMQVDNVLTGQCPGLDALGLGQGMGLDGVFPARLP